MVCFFLLKKIVANENGDQNPPFLLKNDVFNRLS
jgi:hypothetical protein